MKKIFIAVSCAVSLFFVTGCKTLTPNQVSNAVNLINVTVPIGVEYAVMKDTNTIPYFRAAADVIDISTIPGTSPVELINSLNNIGRVNFNTPEARLAVMTGIGIYEAFFVQSVASNTNEVVVLQALSKAIRQGLPPVTTKMGHKSKIKRK